MRTIGKAIFLLLLLVQVAYTQAKSTQEVYTPERRIGVPPHTDNLRTALVIGNAAYKDSPLVNPTNDARDVAQALAGLGFEVIHKENLTQNEVKSAIREFGEKLKNGGVGLFYYAGHGAQVDGRNYLIPIGATIAHEHEVEYEAVDLGLVLAQMERAKNQLNIVILDACRNNPFAQSFRSLKKGLASIDAPGGTLIAYATAPGKVAGDGEGKNGVYTQELLRAMQLPGLKIEEVFKRVRMAVQNRTTGNQIPWESSSLVGDFYFSEGNRKESKSASPMTAEQLVKEADSLVKAGNLTEAQAQYQRAVWLEPNNAKWRTALGLLFMRQKKMVEAEAEFRLASILEPNSSGHHYHLGLALYNQRRIDEAELEYRRAVNLEPQNSRFRESLARVLVSQKKFSEAEKHLREAVRLEPNGATVHNSLGIALARMGRFNEAETEYRMAVKLRPEQAIYYANLGNALASQQKWAEAEKAYQSALQLDPQSRSYQEQLEKTRKALNDRRP